MTQESLKEKVSTKVEIDSENGLLESRKEITCYLRSP